MLGLFWYLLAVMIVGSTTVGPALFTGQLHPWLGLQALAVAISSGHGKIRDLSASISSHNACGIQLAIGKIHLTT
jgi:hypothetical protein